MCLLLIDGIPKIAVQQNLPILGTNFTAAGLVSHPACHTFIPDMLAINASAPGAQEYYDSVIGQWAEQGIDFVYLDGVIQDCAPTAHCWLGEIALIADAMKRLGNGVPKIQSCKLLLCCENVVLKLDAMCMLSRDASVSLWRQTVVQRVLMGRALRTRAICPCWH